MPRHEYLIRFTAGQDLKEGDKVETGRSEVFKTQRPGDAATQVGVVTSGALEGFQVIVRMSVRCEPVLPQYHSGVVGIVEEEREDEAVRTDDDGGASGGSESGE